MTRVGATSGQEIEARSLRIVERDLDRALIALRRVADIADDAAEALAPYDLKRARDLRQRIWGAALSLDKTTPDAHLDRRLPGGVGDHERLSP